MQTIRIWSGKRDSNSRHSRWQRDALPAELFPHRTEIIVFFFYLSNVFKPAIRYFVPDQRVRIVAVNKRTFPAILI